MVIAPTVTQTIFLFWVTLWGYSWQCIQKSLLSWGTLLGPQGTELQSILGQPRERQMPYHCCTAQAPTP